MPYVGLYARKKSYLFRYLGDKLNFARLADAKFGQADLERRPPAYFRLTSVTIRHQAIVRPNFKKNANIKTLLFQKSSECKRCFFDAGTIAQIFMKAIMEKNIENSVYMKFW